MTDNGTRVQAGALVERFYEFAKRGDWAAVLAGWRSSPTFARECAHFVKPTSGWGFLHQAAYAGRRAAVIELIAWGANAGVPSKEGERPADVARRRGHDAIAELINDAFEADHLWVPPRISALLPSSPRWDQARRRVATIPMTVQYAGGSVEIVPGDSYWVDSFERTLIGWHGTFSPPCNMDGEPIIDTGA